MRREKMYSSNRQIIKEMRAQFEASAKLSAQNHARSDALVREEAATIRKAIAESDARNERRAQAVVKLGARNAARTDKNVDSWGEKLTEKIRELRGSYSRLQFFVVVAIVVIVTILGASFGNKFANAHALAALDHNWCVILGAVLFFALAILVINVIRNTHVEEGGDEDEDEKE